MARPYKEGLDYFNLDVNFFEDDKIAFVSASYGLKGDAIVVRLLCKVYKNGYFMNFDQDVALLFSRSVGDINSVGLVKEVVNELLKRGFFDKAVFERFGILTSKAIQKRFAKVCTDAKRKDWVIDENYDLISNKPQLTPSLTPLPPVLSTQIEIESEIEIKEKKSREAASLKTPKPKNILFRESDIFNKEVFESGLKDTKYESADIDHYHEVILNWSDSKNEKKVSWLATAKNWIKRDMDEGKFVSKNSKLQNNGNNNNAIPKLGTSAARLKAVKDW